MSCPNALTSFRRARSHASGLRVAVRATGWGLATLAGLWLSAAAMGAADEPPEKPVPGLAPAWRDEVHRAGLLDLRRSGRQGPHQPVRRRAARATSSSTSSTARGAWADRATSRCGPSRPNCVESLKNLDTVHQFQIIFYNERPVIFNPTGTPGRLAFATGRTRSGPCGSSSRSRPTAARATKRP